MANQDIPDRRVFLRKLLIAATLAPIAAASVSSHASAELPLLSPDDPAATKVKYTEDAKTSKSAVKDNKCANCGLYEGATGAAQGPCQLFPDKHVKAAGWCSAWSPQI